MKRGEGLEEARRRAQRLHHRFGVCAPEHVRITAFAEKLGASVVEARMEGATAQLVRRGRHTQIVVGRHVTDLGARRFCLAHELGHLVLEHPSPSIEGVTSHQAANDERDVEREADAFAAELLMPAQLLQRRCKEAPLGLDVPRQIAHEFRVSILASTIRFVELTSASCAAVLSERGGVRWAVASKTFPYSIPRGRQVAPPSPAGTFFTTGCVNETATPLAAELWIDDAADLSLVEQAVASAEHGTVLSMIWPSVQPRPA